MHDILGGLNEVVGVRGSMVVTHDGMVVAADLSGSLEQDTVAAIATTVIRNTDQALREAQFEGFQRYDLHASHGRMIFVDTGIAYLVVVMERNIEMGPAELEIRSAARRIRQQVEIRI
jgi:predicted regulator of Ras-like GTPase activity (Roadblock/LC7/MglB family)